MFRLILKHALKHPTDDVANLIQELSSTTPTSSICLTCNNCVFVSNHDDSVSLHFALKAINPDTGKLAEYATMLDCC